MNNDFDLWNGKRRKEDDDDGRTPFDRRAMLWLRNSVRDRLTAKHKKGKQKGTCAVAENDPDLEAIVDWFCDEPMRYVRWEPSHAYAGKRYSVGGWTLNLETINLDLETAIDQGRRARLREQQAIETPTLEDWLRADIADTLVYSGAPGGTQDLDEALKERVWLATMHRRAKWPKACIDCKESFTPRRCTARRCDSCQDAERKRQAEKPLTPRVARSAGSPRKSNRETP